MTLDIRIPIGALFILVGMLLAGYGVAVGAPERGATPGFNINVWWGGAVLAFGLAMLWFGRRGAARARETAP